MVNQASDLKLPCPMCGGVGVHDPELCPDLFDEDEEDG